MSAATIAARFTHSKGSEKPWIGLEFIAFLSVRNLQLFQPPAECLLSG
jgi:hypothetical protein